MWLKNYVREYSDSVHTIGRGLLLDTYVAYVGPDPNSPRTISDFPMKEKKGNDSVRYLHYTIQGNTRQDKIRHSKHGTATFVFVVIDCRHGISLFRTLYQYPFGRITFHRSWQLCWCDILYGRPRHSPTLQHIFAGNNVMVWDFNFQSLDDDDDDSGRGRKFV